MDVAQEREGKPLSADIGGMRERAVGADGQKPGAALPDIGVDLDQAGELGRSNTAPVVAVEDEHHILSPKRR